MIKTWAKAQSATVLYRTGIHKVVGSFSGSRGGLVVAGYHRVVEDFASSAETAIPSLLITLKMFERHLDWLGRRYRFVSLNDLDEQTVREGRSGRPAAAITFDDGYRDFYDLAMPLLRKKGIPAALFVVTDLIDTTRVQVHDALYFLLSRRLTRSSLPAPIEGIAMPRIEGMTPFAATRALLEGLPRDALKSLIEAMATEHPQHPDALRESYSVTWDMVAAIHQAGFCIGSHTKSHVLMPNESDSCALDEALGSRTVLESRLNTPVRHFAYPSGAYNYASLRAVAGAGYRFGFTTCHHRSREFPHLTIPRTLLWEQSCLGADGEFSGPVLSCLAEGAFDLLAGCRQLHTAVGRTAARKVAA